MSSTQIGAGTLTNSEMESLANVVESIGEDSPLSRLLNVVIEAQRQGANLTVISSADEYSPQQAAEILQMSRPHLRSFMKSGALAYHMVGSHHRIRHEDLMDFVARREQAAKDVAEALASGDELSAQAIEEVAPLSEAARKELETL